MPQKIIIGEYSPPLRKQLVEAGLTADEAEKYHHRLNVINGLYLLGLYSNKKMKRKTAKLAKAIEARLKKSVIY